MNTNRAMTDDNPARRSETTRDIRRVNAVLLPLLVAGGVALLWRFGVTAATAAALLWATASLTVGGAIGFLFGIPRTRMSEASRSAEPTAAAGAVAATAGSGDSGYSFRPNTNLEEVSDWLTKIIVGLGLVNLKDADVVLDRIADNASKAMAAAGQAAPYSEASALVVGFSVLGFLGAYLYTRLFLQGALIRSDKAGLDEAARRIKREMDQAASQVPEQAAANAEPTPAQIESGQRVAQVVSENPQLDPAARLRELAREYETLRGTMERSTARTQAMSRLVAQMRVLAMAASRTRIDEFAFSRSDGERLVAVILLQIRFDPRFIDWLAERIPAESAFFGFHAAGAMLSAARVADEQTRAALVAAAQKVLARLSAGNNQDSARDGLLQQIVEFGKKK